MQAHVNPEKNYLEQAISPAQLRNSSGKVAWQSPSNIAIVKYWGKHGIQLPRNPSISFTLNNAFTRTQIQFSPKDSAGISLDFKFEGKENPSFEQKLSQYLHSTLPFFPFLEALKLVIESENSFPHSSGIASSASSMSAVVMCLLDIENQQLNTSLKPLDLLQKASYFSRLASGSAARSVFPYASVWGKTEAINGSSDYFGIGIADELHPVFKSFRNSILIVSSGTKSVSSSAGHALMEGNPYAAMRYQSATANANELFAVLQKGDIERFIEIAESEALQLHALMMSSSPSYILMKPNSLSIISAVRDFRKQSGIPLCFTLDAGPNVHLLYPEEYQQDVRQFIDSELLTYCQNGLKIDDLVGEGPQKVI